LDFDKIFVKLYQASVSEAWQEFEKLCAYPEQLQISLLNYILSENKSTEFGIRHDFATIKDVESFQQKVPLSSWKDYEKYSLLMQEGKEDILFPGKPESFIMTSGTAGKKKLIPESSTGRRLKEITDKLRRNFSFNADIMQGKFLPLVNKASLGYTKGGTPYGTASGLILAGSSPKLLQTCSYPPAILKTASNESMDYLLMRFSLVADVRMIIGNNAARMGKLAEFAEINAANLINDIRTGTIDRSYAIELDIIAELQKHLLPDPKRADFLQKIIDNGDSFIPANYWPNLKVICFWLSGSVGSSVQNVKNLFPDNIKYLDYGYGASEGRFNIPHTPGKTSGTLSIHASFYEFIPVDNNDLNPPVLLAHELEKGKSYRLVITTAAGLYRYEMKDIIKVDGFTGRTPDLVFVSKCGDIGNIMGEKLSGTTICEAAARVAQNTGFGIKHICAVTKARPSRYIFCLEFINSPGNHKDIKNIANALDDELRKDIGYGNRRRDNLLLEPEIKVMPEGWLDSLYEEKIQATGNTMTQIKLPVIYDIVPEMKQFTS